MSTFHDLGLSTEILNALEDMGYETPSEIQSKAIPQILQNSNDLKAFAQTGTGKTAAFSLPIIELLDPKSKSPQAIISISHKRISCSNWRQHQYVFKKH